MKVFKGSIVINRNIKVVADLFLDSPNRKAYQDGYVKEEIISGTDGQDGCVKKLYYKYGNRDMILTETIRKNDLPRIYEAFYHHKHMDNTMICRFTPLDQEKTQYDYEYAYTRINWLIPRLMFILFPGMYKKQGDKWNMQFKAFVEAYKGNN